jgi:hypothetical protein
MFLFSDLSRRIHHQDTVLKEKNRDGTQISEVIPQVLIVSPNKNLRLIFFPDKISDALVCRHYTTWVFARFLNDFLGFVECATDLRSTQLLQLTHDTLGHDQEGRLIEQLKEVISEVETIGHCVMEEITIHHDLVGGTKFIDHFIEAHILLILLGSFHSHF